MPRTGGVYAPPAGTKGTPNTTIQSSAFNAWVDDIAADANDPRPLTAGGTGATNETAAREKLGADNASNLKKGELPDGRLTGNYTNVGLLNSAGVILRPTGPEGGEILFQRGTEVTLNGDVTLDLAGSSMRMIESGGTVRRFEFDIERGAISWANFDVSRVFWSSGNDGPDSGLNADLLDGQHGAYYRDASNLSAGIVPPSRLGTNTVSSAGGDESLLFAEYTSRLSLDFVATGRSAMIVSTLVPELTTAEAVFSARHDWYVFAGGVLFYTSPPSIVRQVTYSLTGGLTIISAFTGLNIGATYRVWLTAAVTGGGGHPRSMKSVGVIV